MSNYRYRGTASPLLAAVLALLCGACNPSASVVGGRASPPIDASPTDISPTDASLADAALPTCSFDAAGGFVPVSVVSAVTKVKTLLVGLPPTEEEVRRVTADPTALRELVGQWMTLPPYNEKMQRFFVSAFQQDQFTYDQLVFQFRQYHPFERNVAQILQTVEQSFARTVMALIAEGQPLTAAMTTNRFMMTPALAATYAMLDNIHIDDNYNRVDPFQQTHPTSVTLESSRPIPIEESVDPTSPNYMTFYHPGIATSYAPGCPFGTIVYPSPVSSEVLSHFLYSYRPWSLGPSNCQPPDLPPAARHIRDTDFTTWRMVTIRQPRAGEERTQVYDLPAMRAAPELVLNVPRIGFFSTIAFFARWPTNASNLARVLANQTTIVALGKPIDLTNVTAAGDLTSLDLVHAAPGTLCYECHKSLDPMRQFFRQTYTLFGGLQDDSTQTAIPGQFAFHGVSSPSTGINTLGAQLAAHPLFATAWVQRLCTYATSAACEETDPEFLRLVGVFRDSHFSWNTLVQALFSSPLVTYLSETQTARAAGQPFPISRQEHLCATLSSRLGVSDICGLDVDTPNPSEVAHALSSSWPSGQYSRGSASPVLAVAPSLMIRGGMENLCADLAQSLVGDTPSAAFRSADPTAAIRSIVTRLMGLTSERAAGPQAILQEHFDSARQMGASPDDALKSTFVLGCLSPYVAGIGQ